MKNLLILISLFILGISCTPETILPDKPAPIPSDSIPSDTVDPLYDYELIWASSMLSDTFYSENGGLPKVYKENLLFGAQQNWWAHNQEDQHLMMINPDSRETVWKWDGFNSTPGNRNFLSHTILDNTFYGVDDYNLFAINLQSGETKWKIDTDWSLLSASNGFLFYSDNKSFQQQKAASLFKYDPVNDTHELIHKIPEGGEWYNFLMSCTSSYNENGEEILYFIQYSYRNTPSGSKTILYCYNNDTDEVLWKYETDNPILSSKQPIIDGERVYFGTAHDMYCIEKETGALIWVEKRTRTDGYNSLYRLIDDKIIRISSEGYFKALDKMTGAIIYEHQYGTGYTDDMEYLDGRMYYADGSQLNIIDVATGERLYHWKTKNKNVHEPAFINHVALDPERGVMYVSDWYFINCIKIPD